MTEMENLFVEASSKKKRAKILLYGSYGTGKTVLSLQFPKPVMVDMERGSECYQDKFSFKVFHTTDPDRVTSGIEWLRKNKTDRETIILDSMTEYWSALQSKWTETFLRRNKGKGNKEEFYDLQPRDWVKIKDDFKNFLRSLLSLDMNVICTCRVKDVYQKSTEDFLKKIGETFDSDRSLPYLFDTVCRIEKVEGKHLCYVEKDRTGLLPTSFEASYSVFAKAFGLEKTQAQQPQNREDMVIPDGWIPQDLHGKGITFLRLATDDSLSYTFNGKTVKARHLLHRWATEAYWKDTPACIAGKALLEKYPSQSKPEEKPVPMPAPAPTPTPSPDAEIPPDVQPPAPVTQGMAEKTA